MSFCQCGEVRNKNGVAASALRQRAAATNLLFAARHSSRSLLRQPQVYRKGQVVSGHRVVIPRTGVILSAARVRPLG